MGMQPFINYREQQLKNLTERSIEKLRENLRKCVVDSTTNETNFNDVRAFLLVAKDDNDLNLVLQSFKL
jgi:hypothetical protein